MSYQRLPSLFDAHFADCLFLELTGFSILFLSKVLDGHDIHLSPIRGLTK
jgi:hypothetical protein